MSTSSIESAPSSQSNRPRIYERLTRSGLRDALYKMQLIRRFEESAEDAYVRGQSYGTMHLSIGEEATAVGACAPLSDSDYITSTHRGHGHCIAKGAEVKRMFAEFLGRETGYCRGRGGSMHIADPSKGNLGANGIVGGGIPIAVGAGAQRQDAEDGRGGRLLLRRWREQRGRVPRVRLNMAAIWKLPVVFVCENNNYGMSMSTERSTAVRRIAERASAYSMPGVTVDGNSFAEVAEASFGAADRARRGEGPSLIECLTYRIRGHSKSDRNRYRTKEEIEAWKGRDPIAAFERELESLGVLTRSEIESIRSEVEEEIRQGVAFAEAKSCAARRGPAARRLYELGPPPHGHADP